MKRALADLTDSEFDLLVVGGGMFGACAAWDAAQRGLSVALVERGDFAGETSSNHFRVVHGGIRYLQHADLVRVRESSRERSALLRIAPHLVSPIPILMPTYGHGKRGKALVRVGCVAYDLITADRNRHLEDAERRIPRSYTVSRPEARSLFPELPGGGLTGGIVFWDGQIHHPARLVLAFLRSAHTSGRARLANYVAARQLLRRNGRVCGVEAEDILGGGRISIRARVVLNAAGPWAAELLDEWLGLQPSPRPTFSRDLALVTRHRLRDDMGLACPSGSTDADAILDRGGRHLFLLPWRGGTLVGVWHKVHAGPGEGVRVDAAELGGYLREANDVYPGLGLKPDDILEVLTGLVLFGDEDQEPGAHRFGKRSLLIDHEKEHGVPGLVSLVGVRASVARGMAAKALDLVARGLGRRLPGSRTDRTPLHGGDVPSVSALLAEARSRVPDGVAPAAAEALARNHGSRYVEILALARCGEDLARTLGSSTVLGAEAVHAVREEMAVTLEDVVLRRTDLAVARIPPRKELMACAALVGAELGWDEERCRAEVERVEDVLAGRAWASPARSGFRGAAVATPGGGRTPR